MRTSTRLTAWAAAPLAAGLMLSAVALAPTASAATKKTCPIGAPCFWRDADRQGWIYTHFSNNLPSQYNDQASSFQDNWSGNVTWWWDAGCMGNVAMVLSPGQWQNASWFNNDETSSVCRG